MQGVRKIPGATVPPRLALNRKAIVQEDMFADAASLAECLGEPLRMHILTGKIEC
jgi:hypothetical protein